MPVLTLLVTADPASSYLAPLKRLPAGTRLIVSNRESRCSKPRLMPTCWSKAIFIIRNCFSRPSAAPRLRWIHVLSAGIDRQLSPEILASPVPMTTAAASSAVRWANGSSAR